MKKEVAQHFEDFSEVLSVLEKNLKYVEQLGMDEGTIRAYRKVLFYLRGRTKIEIDNILGVKAPGVDSKQKPGALVPMMTDEECRGLSKSSVLALISDEKLPRTVLEKVAALRFGLTKGGISSLRTRKALLEKIVRMLDHEATHQSIARAASGAVDESPSASSELSGVTVVVEKEGLRDA